MFVFLTFAMPAFMRTKLFFLEGTSSFLLEALVILVFALATGFLGGKCLSELIKKNYRKAVPWAIGLLVLLIPLYVLNEAAVLVRPVLQISINLLVCSTTGFLWGIWTWSWSEKIYRKELAKREAAVAE